MAVGQDLLEKIRIIPDFPKEGIQFLDMDTLFRDKAGFARVLDLFAAEYKNSGIEQVVGIEARGFVLGGALADRLGCGFTMIRKPGKLPADTISKTYDLEYGTNEIHIHADAVKDGCKLLMIDDLLATGGTMAAACDLVTELGGEVVAAAFIVELAFLPGREKLHGRNCFSLAVQD